MPAPSSKEFYEEWELRLTPDANIPSTSISIYLNPSDRVRLTPPDATLSDSLPGWVTGFPEPTRKPDFFKRVVRFLNLSSKRQATIEVRRLINPPRVTRSISNDTVEEVKPPDVVDTAANKPVTSINVDHLDQDPIIKHIHVAGIDPGLCLAEWPDEPPDYLEEGELAHQFLVLANWKLSKQLPWRSKANHALKPGTAEQTVEVHCSDILCKKTRVVYFPLVTSAGADSSFADTYIAAPYGIPPQTLSGLLVEHNEEDEEKVK
jgi:hypothetical protein